MVQSKCLRNLVAVTLLFSKILFCHVTGDSTSQRQQAAADVTEVTTLNILALGPYPATSEALTPSWAGGPALIPAAQLAAELINNDSTILPGYHLNVIPVDSGCQLISTLFINFIEKLIYSQNEHETTVGIVGPGCSEATIALAPIILKDELNLMQISIATTPLINDNPVYNNTFRTVSSELKFIDTFKSLVTLTNWKRYAVFHDSARIFHKTLFVQFRDTFKNQSDNFYSSEVNDFLLKDAFESLLELRLRIIIVFAGGQVARQVMCAAYNQSMLFPTYQWIFTSRVIEDFLKDTTIKFGDSQINCNVSEMEKAINCIILSTSQFHRDNSNITTASGLTLEQYNTSYEEFYNKHLQEYSLNQSSVTAGAKRFSDPYFDATWALALALNSSLNELRENDLSLARDYRYGMSTTKVVGNIIQEHIRSLEFEGLGGRIMYNSTESRSISPSLGVRVIQVNFLQDDRMDLVCSDKCTQFDSINVKILRDNFVPNIIKPPFSLGVFILIVVSVSFFAVTLLQLLYFYHSEKKSIKATSPYLSSLIFSGSYLGLVSAITFTVRETFVDNIYKNPKHFGILCSTFISCTTFSTTLIFGTLGVKTWRIYRIFGYFRQGRVRFVSDWLLLSFVLLLLTIDCLFLLAWNIIDPWHLRVKRPHLADGDHLTLQCICECGHLQYWVISLSVYKAVLVAVVVYLSILIRRIKRREFIFTKYIIALTYLLILLNAILLPVYILFIDKVPLLSFVAQNILVLTTVFASCAFLFIPPLRLVWNKRPPQATRNPIGVVQCG